MIVSAVLAQLLEQGRAINLPWEPKAGLGLEVIKVYQRGTHLEGCSRLRAQKI